MTQKVKKILDDFRALSRRDRTEFVQQVAEEFDEILEWSISPKEVGGRIAAANSGVDEVMRFSEAMKRLRDHGAKLSGKR